MHLWLHNPDSAYFVRRCDTASITVVDREITTSFILAADKLIEPWTVEDVAALTVEQIGPILELEPEVVLLGSGATLRFPAQAVFAAFLTRRIGLEAMDNTAAARTFNVLAAEGRKVVAAFILPAPALMK